MSSFRWMLIASSKSGCTEFHVRDRRSNSQQGSYWDLFNQLDLSPSQVVLTSMLVIGDGANLCKIDADSGSSNGCGQANIISIPPGAIYVVIRVVWWINKAMVNYSQVSTAVRFCRFCFSIVLLWMCFPVFAWAVMVAFILCSRRVLFMNVWACLLWRVG